MLCIPHNLTEIMQINQSDKCQRVCQHKQRKSLQHPKTYIDDTVNLAHAAKVCQQNSRNRKSRRNEELAVPDVCLITKAKWATNNLLVFPKST